MGGRFIIKFDSGLKLKTHITMAQTKAQNYKSINQMIDIELNYNLVDQVAFCTLVMEEGRQRENCSYSRENKK